MNKLLNLIQLQSTMGDFKGDNDALFETQVQMNAMTHQQAMDSITAANQKKKAEAPALLHYCIIALDIAKQFESETDSQMNAFQQHNEWKCKYQIARRGNTIQLMRYNTTK
eukprot:890825_1